MANCRCRVDILRQFVSSLLDGSAQSSGRRPLLSFSSRRGYHFTSGNRLNASWPGQGDDGLLESPLPPSEDFAIPVDSDIPFEAGQSKAKSRKTLSSSTYKTQHEKLDSAQEGLTEGYEASNGNISSLQRGGKKDEVPSARSAMLDGRRKAVQDSLPSASIRSNRRQEEGSSRMRNDHEAGRTTPRSSASRISTSRASASRSSRTSTGATLRTSSRALASKDTYSEITPHVKENWQIQKAALEKKFGDEGWQPRKRLSPDALEGIRALHTQFPTQYPTHVLADQFKVSPEMIRRILKSKWQPTEEQQVTRQERWLKRGEKIWTEMVKQGAKPPKKWREMGIGNGKRSTQRYQRPSWTESPPELMATSVPAKLVAEIRQGRIMADRIL